MALKFVILAAAVAAVNAGIIGAPAAIGYGAPAYAAAPVAAVHAAPAYAAPAYAAPAYGHAVATPAITAQHSNILRTPGNLGQISTYSKSIDTPYSSVRKSDVRVSNDALAYGHVAAPVAAYAAPAYAHAAPAYAHAAPAYAPAAYAPGPIVAKAPVAAYAAPAYAAGPVVKTAATAVAGHGLLGVAYSAAPAVAHMTYSNGLGLNYAW